MAPEYYVDYSGETAVTDWDALGDGATKTYTAFVDKTAPELSDVYFKESVETGDKVLELVAQDNRYVAAAFLIDYDEQAILSKSAGSPEGAARGEAVTLNLDMGNFSGDTVIAGTLTSSCRCMTTRITTAPIRSISTRKNSTILSKSLLIKRR